jgi:hypothetical protein
MKILTVTLPAFLASALINNDTSGLEPGDLKWVKVAQDYCEGDIVDVGEPYFSWGCELPGYTLGGDVAEYTVFISE